MRTLFASIVTLLFFASAAHACPFSGHSDDKVVKKPKPVVVIGT